MPTPGGRRRCDLVCLDRNSPKPLVLPLEFGTHRHPLPFGALDEWLLSLSQSADGSSPIWLAFAGDFLCIGRPTFRGVWAIPKAEIDAAISVERRVQPDPVYQREQIHNQP